MGHATKAVFQTAVDTRATKCSTSSKLAAISCGTGRASGLRWAWCDPNSTIGVRSDKPLSLSVLTACGNPIRPREAWPRTCGRCNSTSRPNIPAEGAVGMTSAVVRATACQGNSAQLRHLLRIQLVIEAANDRHPHHVRHDLRAAHPGAPGAPCASHAVRRTERPNKCAHSKVAVLGVGVGHHNAHAARHDVLARACDHGHHPPSALRATRPSRRLATTPTASSRSSRGSPADKGRPALISAGQPRRFAPSHNQPVVDQCTRIPCSPLATGEKPRSKPPPPPHALTGSLFSISN